MSLQRQSPRRRLGKLSRATLWYASGFEEVQALDMIANYENALHRLYATETPLAAEIKIKSEIVVLALVCTFVHILAFLTRRPSA